MAGKVSRRWSDLSERNRRLLIAAAAVDGALKAAALADLKRRPASEVRGPKGAWAAGVVAVNSFGAAPLPISCSAVGATTKRGRLIARALHPTPDE